MHYHGNGCSHLEQLRSNAVRNNQTQFGNLKKCWSANAFFRPSAKDIDYLLVEMSSKDTEPLETCTDHIRDNLKRKPTSLYDVFPKHIADALNAGKKVEAESHEIVTIVFSDIVGFTTISERLGPLKVSNMLDRLYNAFDKLANEHNVFKVETIVSPSPLLFFFQSSRLSLTPVHSFHTDQILG